MRIPFEHTTNVTVAESVNAEHGHNLFLHIHPQKALTMKDYLDIEFVPKALQSNNEMNEPNDSKEVEHDDENTDADGDVQLKRKFEKLQKQVMRLKLTAKVLRKEQGTPMLKSGVSCLTKGSMYNTDLSATECE